MHCCRLPANRIMKNSVLQRSLVWQVRCQRQHCKSQPQGFRRHKQSLPIFKEPAWFVGWKQQSKCQGFWGSENGVYQINHTQQLQYVKLSCFVHCSKKKKAFWRNIKTQMKLFDSALLTICCFDYMKGEGTRRKALKATYSMDSVKK